MAILEFHKVAKSQPHKFGEKLLFADDVKTYLQKKIYRIKKMFPITYTWCINRITHKYHIYQNELDHKESCKALPFKTLSTSDKQIL